MLDEVLIFRQDGGLVCPQQKLLRCFSSPGSSACSYLASATVSWSLRGRRSKPVEKGQMLVPSLGGQLWYGKQQYLAQLGLCLQTRRLQGLWRDQQL